MVEDALRSRQRAEEAILEPLVEDGEREQRIEDGRAKKADWARRFWLMESEKMTGRLQGMSLSEEREALEMTEMGDELRDMDGDIEMEDDHRARKRTSFARRSCLKFKGRLKKVTMKVDTLGTIQ